MENHYTQNVLPELIDKQVIIHEVLNIKIQLLSYNLYKKLQVQFMTFFYKLWLNILIIVISPRLLQKKG